MELITHWGIQSAPQKGVEIFKILLSLMVGCLIFTFMKMLETDTGIINALGVQGAAWAAVGTAITGMLIGSLIPMPKQPLLQKSTHIHVFKEEKTSSKATYGVGKCQCGKLRIKSNHGTGHIYFN